MLQYVQRASDSTTMGIVSIDLLAVNDDSERRLDAYAQHSPRHRSGAICSTLASHLG
jgi:hypothetical protein